MKTGIQRLLVAVGLGLSLLACSPALAFYNPNTGRWISRDPIQEQGGGNLYGFVHNNSLSGIDCQGLATLSFEVVTGIWVGYAGVWSQPFWAGDGDYSIGAFSVWSKVDLDNGPSIFDRIHYPDDYCNTVQVFGGIGTKGDAGHIKIFAIDDCGGTFRISGLYTAKLSGAGANPAYGYAVLSVNGSIVSSITATATSPSVAAIAAISTEVTLEPKRKKLVAEYRPTLGLKPRNLFGGESAYVVASALISMQAPVKVK